MEILFHPFRLGGKKQQLIFLTLKPAICRYSKIMYTEQMIDFELPTSGEINGLSWSDVKENASEIGSAIKNYGQAQVANQAATAQYNAAVVASMNQDSENKRALYDALTKSVFVIVVGLVVFFLIKTFRK